MNIFTTGCWRWNNK